MRQLAIALLATFASLSFVVPPASAGEVDALGWELVGVDDGVTTKRMKVDGSSLLAFRGDMVADVAIAKILQIFLDDSEAKNWVDRFKGSETLAEPTEYSRQYWIRFDAPPLVADRDYVLTLEAKVDEVAQVLVADIESSEHAAKPDQDCCVRGVVFQTYYRFEALGPEKTRVEVEVHTDPKGRLPDWVVNLVQKSWPNKTLTALVERASQESVTPREEFAAWAGAGGS